jgi:L-ascorbate metabolism protein UlaG (beta-lactamase superfamily)
MMTKLHGLLLSGVVACVFANGNNSGESLASQIRSHHKGTAICWTGNAGWLIKSGDLLIGTDLTLDNDEKVHPPPLTASDIAPDLDVVFATHHHGDHCNPQTLQILAQRGKCTFVLPSPCLKELSGIGIKIPSDRLIVPEPLHPFTVRGIRVEPIHAIHGNQEFTVLTREPDFIDKIVHNCGYVIEIGGKRFLEPGDSVLTEEHLSLKNIDVLFISPTVHNMYIDRSTILINHLQPRYIFPQHFGTYIEIADELFWRRGYPDELKLQLTPELQGRYHKLSQGQIFEIE